MYVSKKIILVKQCFISGYVTCLDTSTGFVSAQVAPKPPQVPPIGRAWGGLGPPRPPQVPPWPTQVPLGPPRSPLGLGQACRPPSASPLGVPRPSRA